MKKLRNIIIATFFSMLVIFVNVCLSIRYVYEVAILSCMLHARGRSKAKFVKAIMLHQIRVIFGGCCQHGVIRIREARTFFLEQ
jgi:hypothetical protein